LDALSFTGAWIQCNTAKCKNESVDVTQMSDAGGRVGKYCGAVDENAGVETCERFAIFIMQPCGLHLETCPSWCGAKTGQM
jgi:hypothetical protein